MQKTWLICLDRGGTFTDGIAFAPDGSLRIAKVLSGSDSPFQALRATLGLEAHQALPPCEVRLGSTLATNALLERNGCRHALLITQGFADALLVGHQQRPELFTLRIHRPAALAARVMEAEERLGPDGQVEIPLNASALREGLLSLFDAGFRSLAIVFLHACRNPTHELLAGELARNIGFEYVALSHESDPAPGLLDRGQTTCADAYLTPLLRDHLRDFQTQLQGSPLLCLQSNGVLSAPEKFRGQHALLSGPAGGGLACLALARRLGLKQVIGFDMGGTSADVSRWQTDADADRDYAQSVAGLRLRMPSMAIHTVAAGGGSLCRVVGGRLLVGPESAGAFPGPLCYGQSHAGDLSLANRLTLTDINLYLGRLLESNFPFPLQREPVDKALHEQTLLAREQGMPETTPEALALGYRQIVDQAMAQAIREVTLSRGREIAGHALIAFGGAGGQHACAVAQVLGLGHVIVPPLAGLFSALGMSQANQGWEGMQSLPASTLNAAALAEAEKAWMHLESEARLALPNQSLNFKRRLDLRYAGSDSSMSLVCEGEPAAKAWLENFAHEHETVFGYRHAHREVEITATRLTAETEGHRPWPEPAPFPGGDGHPRLQEAAWLTSQGRISAPVLRRENLPRDWQAQGPILLLDAAGTTAIDAGWHARLDGEGNLHMTPALPPSMSLATGPAELTLFHAAFMGIAGEMGRVLQRTAVSTNIKERLDFSCALFDDEGRLVANAPHIPVHLGAMGESVRHAMATHKFWRPGDCIATNHPGKGGSHLPDITLISPVFLAHDAEARPAFFVANRAHHADVGGSEPGSMPAESTSLAEEGVLLDALLLTRGGRFDEAAFAAAFQGGLWPARNTRDNRADLQAQLAANAAGARGLARLCAEQGATRVVDLMRRLRANAAEQTRAALRLWGNRTATFADALDDGSPIVVALTAKDGCLLVDFAGTGEAMANNLNAPSAVVRSCLLYVLRCLIDAPMPLNEGCLQDVTLRLPEACLLRPPEGFAVVGGNVETSQRVVDVLLGAFGLAAASQGTMNNVTFGDSGFGYYETLGGGEGACPGHQGCSAVHTHMTNTRLTDPEILEQRYPVRMMEFGLRRGSGGTGEFQGGEGMVRHYRFLRSLRVSLLTQRRRIAPWGAQGGGDGRTGRNLLKTVVGPWRELPGSISLSVEAGEEIRLETPGGGGWGKPIA